jgi:HEAT repeat protein
MIKDMIRAVFLYILIAILSCRVGLVPAIGGELGQKTRQDIDDAINNLGSGRMDLKRTAIKELVGLGSDAVGPLLETIKDSESKSNILRARCIYVLGEIGDNNAVPELISILKESDNKKLRSETIKALGKIGDERASPFLLKMLKDEELSIRFYAVESLAKIGDPEVSYAISNILLTDPDKNIRLEAIRALDTLNARSESNTVISALSDNDKYVRAYAAGLAASWDIKKALLKIVNMLRFDEDDIVRISSAQALGVYKDRSAAAILIEALSDESTEVRIEASRALAEISGENYGFDDEKWNKWFEEEVKEKLN